MADPASINLAEVAADVGLRPTRILQSAPGRVVAQACDDLGRLFLLKSDVVPGALAADVAANRTLVALGLPVPEIVDYRDRRPTTLVLRWIDGEPISSASPVSAQRQAGRLLRAVHQVRADPPFSGQPTIARWIAAWTEELLDWWPRVGATSAEVRGLRSKHAEIAQVLAGRQGRLTLFDGRTDHFLVRDDRLVGVIDLHDLGAGDPAMDLAVIGLTDPALITGVLSGYGDGVDDVDERASLIAYYLLLRRLAGAEWHLRNGSEAMAERLLGLARSSLVAP